MLKLLKRWLGWDSSSSPFDFSGFHFGSRKTPPMPGPDPIQRATQAKNAAANSAQAAAQAAGKRPADAKKPKKERTPIDVLDNPRLTLDRPNDDGFDPYNTGAFNRSQSWEKIGKHKR
jgi:hypothetical protein